MWAQEAFSGDIMNLKREADFLLTLLNRVVKSWFIKDSMSFHLVLNFFFAKLL